MNNFNQFEIRIVRDIEENKHLHTAVELIYVIEGEITIRIKDAKFELAKDDVIVINSSVQHSTISKGNSIVCSIKYDYQVLVHILKKPNSIFWCNSSIDFKKDYIQVQKLCRDIIYQEVVAQHKTESQKYSLLYQLLDELVEHYMLDDTNNEISENYDADEKLQIIIHYVHQNYQDGISLSDLAKQMYTSTSTLSRLFKKQTGTYFAEFVNQVRTKYAIDELLYTEKNMTKIAMDCGFSNASAFTKVFKETYGITPTEYRINMKGKQEKKQKVDEDIKSVITERFISKEKEAVGRNQIQTAEVDVTQLKPINRNWNTMINIGFIHNLTSANFQYHTTYLVKELGFKYGRVWNIFNKNTMVSDGRTAGDYNFDIIFEGLDFLVNNHIIPWLDFTNRPYANSKNASETLWFENISVEFEDKLVWEELFPNFVEAIIQRYGIEEVAKWRYEIGAEFIHKEYDERLVGFGHSNIELYNFVAKSIKEKIPEACIGYAAGPGFEVNNNITDELKSVADGKYRPDFISFMLFPYNLSVDEKTGLPTGGYIRSEVADFEGQYLERVQTLMDKIGLQDIKLVVSEWNVTVSNSNYLNDSTYRGSKYIEVVSKYFRNVESIGIWVASDWLSNSFRTRGLTNGCGGILTKDTIRKPLYFAIKMLNRMGNELIDIGDNYMVTKSGEDDYHIVCFNPTTFSSAYFVREEDQLEPSEIKSFFDMSATNKLTLKLKGVKENEVFKIKKRQVNDEHGSVLGMWESFDYDNKFNRQDIKYIQETCLPYMSMSKHKASGNCLEIEVEMQTMEFCELHVYLDKK